MKKAKKYDYAAVNLPSELLKRIDTLRKEHPRLNFRSRADFVKKAIESQLISFEELTDPVYLDELQKRLETKITFGTSLNMIPSEEVIKKLVSIENEIKKLKKK